MHDNITSFGLVTMAVQAIAMCASALAVLKYGRQAMVPTIAGLAVLVCFSTTAVMADVTPATVTALAGGTPTITLGVGPTSPGVTNWERKIAVGAILSVTTATCMLAALVALRWLWQRAIIGWRGAVFNDSNLFVDNLVQEDDPSELPPGVEGPVVDPNRVGDGRHLATKIGYLVRSQMGYPSWSEANMTIATKRISTILTAEYPDLRVRDRAIVLAKSVAIALTPSIHEVELATLRNSAATARREHYVRSVHKHNPTFLPNWLAWALGLYVEARRDF